VILVDTNVLVDVLTDAPNWAEWSIIALRNQSADQPLIINEVVYAELAVRITSEAELDAALATLRVRLERIPKSALFRAGKAFRDYRRMGGTRTGVLPDLFIGAHAEISGLPLLTRDVRRYRTYFSGVKLIAPER
jgi:predicted nucleic acid-binding protein